MARRRLHVRRHAALLAIIALLMALFELNQWLPGGWPGGGGDGGFRAADTPREDPSRIRPPLGATPEWRVARIQISVRGPGGEDVAGWRVRGADGAGVEAEDDQPLMVDGHGLAKGFRIEGPGSRQLDHGPASAQEGAHWVVHLPDAAATGEDGPPREAPLRVVRAEDDLPIRDARVAWAGWTDSGTLTTDDQGKAVAPAAGRRIHVSISAPGRFAFEGWIDPRVAPETTVRLVAKPGDELTFVDAESGKPIEVDRLRILGPSDQVLMDEEDLLEPLGRRDRLDFDRVRGGEELERAVLEVGGKSHPVARIRLAEAPAQMRLPRGRTVRIRATDLRGQLVSRVRLEAHYVPPMLGTGPLEGDEPREVSVPQGAYALLPQGVEARVLVEAGSSAPRALEIPVDPEHERSTVKLGMGGRLKVEVVEDESRQPVSRAEVVVAAAVDGVRLERRARSGADGVVQWNELPQGWIEVYARAPGKAWAAATHEITENSESTVVIALQQGGSIQLIVETPAGVPIPGVRVRAEPEERDRADVVPPGAQRMVTDEDGALVLQDLLDRSYRLHLTKPGYGRATLHRIRPGGATHFATLVPNAR